MRSPRQPKLPSTTVCSTCDGPARVPAVGLPDDHERAGRINAGPVLVRLEADARDGAAEAIEPGGRRRWSATSRSRSDSPRPTRTADALQDGPVTGDTNWTATWNVRTTERLTAAGARGMGRVHFTTVWNMIWRRERGRLVFPNPPCRRNDFATQHWAGDRDSFRVAPVRVRELQAGRAGKYLLSPAPGGSGRRRCTSVLYGVVNAAGWCGAARRRGGEPDQPRRSRRGGPCDPARGRRGDGRRGRPAGRVRHWVPPRTHLATKSRRTPAA